MSSTTDTVDGITNRLAEMYPDLDTGAFGVTGRIIRLGQAIESKRAAFLADYGLTCGDFDVLATIRRTADEDGANPGQLLDSVLITSGTMTKRLDRLETAGLISRHPDPDDRRGVLVRLTQQGVETIDSVYPALLAMESEVLSTELTAAQLSQAAQLLRRVGVSLNSP